VGGGLRRAVSQRPVVGPRRRDGEELRGDHARRRPARPGPADGVFEGSTGYLDGPSDPVDSPAARDLVERARGREGDDPLYVVAIGAPTNVASALLREPEIVEDVVVVWLGGTPHDWHTAEEFNLRQDVRQPDLFDSGVPLVHVPCRNVAEHLRISLPELQEYLDDGALVVPDQR